MTKRTNATRLGTATVLAGFLATSIVGCQGEPPPPPPPVVVAPPAPPPLPKVTPISELMAKLNIDSRVHWPEDRAPVTVSDPDREAILTFFDTFARGDSSRLQPMLSSTDQYELENLVTSGAWEATAKKIAKIDIRCGKSPDNKPCVLAIYQTGENFEPQLWAYAKKPTGEMEFEAVATPPNIMQKLSGEDWITAWYDLLQKELELANKPDEAPQIPQTNLASNNDESSGATSAPAGPSAAPSGAPSGPAPSKRPPGPPIKAPKPGFGQN